MSSRSHAHSHISIWLRVLGLVGLAFGLAIAIPGFQLIMLGGSWYYLIAGLGTIAAGLLIFGVIP